MQIVPITQRCVNSLSDVAFITKQLIEAVNNILKGGIPVLHLATHNREPIDYVNGETIVVADGSNWNPGSGAGLYYRTSGGAWTKIA